MIYWQSAGVTLHQGDALATLKELEAESTQLVVTSPPYNTGNTARRNTPKHSHWQAPAHGEWYDDNLTQGEYEHQQIAVLEAVARVLKADGSVLYNHRPRPWGRRVIHPLDWLRRVSGLALVQEIVWARPGGMLHNSGVFLPTHEMIYWLCRADGKPRWPARHAIDWGTVWYMAADRDVKEHPCAFPLELPKRCIAALTEPGEVVLDPYAGSGQTLLAAQELGRQALGIELVPQFCDLIRRRLSEQPSLLQAASS